MSKSIFISHVFEDGGIIQQIESWKDQLLLGDVAITKETNKDLRNQGEAVIKNHLVPKIRGCAAVLVLVGNDTHNHQWITYEVEVARSLNKKVIAVRIKDTTGAPPKILASHGLTKFSAAAIKLAIEG
jgi:hypothetical protein